MKCEEEDQIDHPRKKLPSKSPALFGLRKLRNTRKSQNLHGRTV